MNDTIEIDAAGLLCPLPVLRLRKNIESLKRGTVIIFLADDPAAAIDIPYFCAETGHKIISVSDLPGPNDIGQTKKYIIRTN